MLSNEQIKLIIENSLNYPSGDNSQPWNFNYSKGKLNIFLDKSRTDHPLDFGGLSSAISLGCLVEAIDISASLISYNTEVEYHIFENKEDNCWATISFTSNPRIPDPLSPYMKERTTDRRLYSNGEIPIDAIECTIKTIKENSDIKVHYLTKLSNLFVDYIVRSEELMMDHNEILIKTLSWVRFTKASAEHTRDGLSLKNLGVKFWEIPTLMLIKKFPGLLNIFKPEMIRQHKNRVRRQISSSAGVILITIPKGKPQIAPVAGRAMYRIWLELTRHGFGIQPLTLSSLPIYGVKENISIKNLHEKWKYFFDIAENIIGNEVNFPPTHRPFWMIRTGKSSLLPSEQRTFRRKIEDVLKFND